jgi:pimeloyl-ACP methyl ester carboxylesterase
VRVDEHTITLGQEPVFYRSASWTGVPALYLHGLPTSSQDWTAFLERTGGLAPDLPGFGRSGKGGHLDYTIEAHATFIEAFLASLEVQTVRLVAHGWGAGGGLVFALRHPERIERLVLCDALPLLGDFEWQGLPKLLRRPLLGELVMGSTQRWMLARALRGASVSTSAWPDEAIASVWEQFDQGTQRAILRIQRSADERGLAEAGAGLDRLQMPALVIWGERDPWFGPALADAYASRLPNATVQRIADAGHWPWLDVPAVVDQIAAFVAS